jgi:hypothetical protein
MERLKGCYYNLLMGVGAAWRCPNPQPYTLSRGVGAAWRNLLLGARQVLCSVAHVLLLGGGCLGSTQHLKGCLEGH